MEGLRHNCHPSVCALDICTKAGEDHSVHARSRLQRGSHCCDCDRSGQLQREAVDPGADRRECDTPKGLLGGESHCRAVGRREELSLTAASSAPDRADGVNDEPRRQSVAGSDARFTGRTPADRGARTCELRAGGSMNCATYPSTWRKGLICRVDDRVGIEGGDIDDLGSYLHTAGVRPSVTQDGGHAGVPQIREVS
jgi:hypothetical protein